MSFKGLASIATVSLILVGGSVACGPVGLPSLSGGDSTGAAQPANVAVRVASDAAPSVAAAATTRPYGPQAVPVKRGSLTQTLTLDGVIIPQAQEPVTYAWRSIVEDVKVKPGDSVKKGDPLVDFSSTDAVHNLDTARAQLKLAQANLLRAQSDTDSRRAAAARKFAADQRAQQKVIADAETALKRAEENLVTVKAGRSPAQLQVADTAVTYYGSTTLASAQDALDKLLAGPDPAAIKAAQRDVDSANLMVTKARADLDNLLKGPDPATVRDAQLNVQKAQTQVQAAQSAKIDAKAPDQAVARQQHDLAIQDAQNALDRAQASLTQLKQPPPQIDVQAARFRVTDAESTLATAQSRLETLQAGPDQAAIDGAQHNVEYAKHALSEMQAGADELRSHPQPWELAQAEDQVRAARSALDNARQPLQAPDDTTDLSDLQDAVAQAQVGVSTAERSVEDTHVRAPFDGTVVSLRAKPGDTIVPSKPLLFLARPGPPLVHIDLDDASAAQLVVGQKASVQAGVDGGSTIDATVASVIPAAKDGSVGASATLSVDWSGGPTPKLGMPASIVVAIQQKLNVLTVPKSAVRRSGARSTVEVQDGSLRRLVTVQTGIATSDSVEIVSGLTEGQTVLAAPS